MQKNLIIDDIVTLSSFGASRSVSKCELRKCCIVTLRYNPDKSGSLRVTKTFHLACHLKPPFVPPWEEGHMFEKPPFVPPYEGGLYIGIIEQDRGRKK
jgi:hypothetical protein